MALFLTPDIFGDILKTLHDFLGNKERPQGFLSLPSEHHFPHASITELTRIDLVLTNCKRKAHLLIEEDPIKITGHLDGLASRLNSRSTHEEAKRDL